MSLVRLDHDPLKRLEVGVLAKEVHPADRSVQDMVHLPARCFSRCSWHGQETYQKAVAPVNTSCVPVFVPFLSGLPDWVNLFQNPRG